jgi:hypothetical protein
LGWLLINIDEQAWLEVAEKMRAALPEAAVPSYGYVEQSLELRETLRAAMMGMNSRQFEKVLHPIFQVDNCNCYCYSYIYNDPQK